MHQCFYFFLLLAATVSRDLHTMPYSGVRYFGSIIGTQKQFFCITYPVINNVLSFRRRFRQNRLTTLQNQTVLYNRQVSQPRVKRLDGHICHFIYYKQHLGEAFAKFSQCLLKMFDPSPSICILVGSKVMLIQPDKETILRGAHIIGK